MTFFDSPIARCEAIHELVLTDETQAECAREHDCPLGRICPLCGYFTVESGIADNEPTVLTGRRREFPSSSSTP